MSLALDLLDTAIQLSRIRPETEAALRRSISTAYYALFHLIIETACENWPQPQRGRVARQFDHKRMRDVSADTARRKPHEPTEAALALVADTFVELQKLRHAADYDLNAVVVSEEVELNIMAAENAFKVWDEIRREPIVQDYLFSLLFKDRP